MIDPLPSILLVGPTPPPFSGMSAQVARWTERLRQEGHVVRVASTRFDLASQPLRRAVVFLAALLRELLRCDVVNVHTGSHTSFFMFAATSILAGRLAGRTVVLTYKGGEAREFFARSAAARAVARLATVVTVPSPFLQEVFAGLGIAARIVPNVLPDPRDLGGDDAPRAAAGDPTLLVSRNLEPVYSVETALLAFARVRERRPGAVLLVYGDGSERPRLERLVTEQAIDGVRFLGNVPSDEVVKALRVADVFVNPSTVDNTPNSLLEALLAGVPVVTTNVGGIPILVREGESALLVPPRNPDAMAAALQRVLEDPELAARLRSGGREVARPFLWDQVYPAYRRALGLTAAVAAPSPVRAVPPPESGR